MHEKQPMKAGESVINALTAALLAVMVALTATMGVLVVTHQQFSYLAAAFIQGKLYFVDNLPMFQDTVFHNGVYFWPQGPLPAVLLAPFVAVARAIGFFFYQGYLQTVVVLLTLLFTFRSVRVLGFTLSDSTSLVLAFLGSSAYLGIAIHPCSWQFAQAVTVLLYSALLYEYLTKKRYGLIGTLIGLLCLTRITAALAVLFFIIACLKTSAAKTKDLTKLLVPVMIALTILALYNYARFGSPFEQGYSEQGYSDQLLTAELVTARHYGLMGLTHLPGNLYYAFLSMPVPVFKDEAPPVLAFPYLKANPWGMSIFITSPYLLLLFLGSYKKWEPRALLGTSLVIAVPILLYYGVGFYQFGYRYALDFFPLLFLLFVQILRDRYQAVPIPLKVLILLSVPLNVFLFFTIF